MRLPRRLPTGTLLALSTAGLSALLGSAAQAYPNPGGLGGPRSGVGVYPGAGAGAPGVGLTPTPGVGAPGTPAENCVQRPGVGCTPAPGVGAGGVGGPASGRGVMPGAGWGRAGAGLR